MEQSRLDPYARASGDASERMRLSISEVRQALIAFPGRERNGWLMHFPHGSCDVSSWILGLVLEARGLGTWTLVSGITDSDVRPDLGFRSHSWLELRDDTGRTLLTIDPTADQFDYLGPVDVMEGAGPQAAIFTSERRQHDASAHQSAYEYDIYRLPMLHVMTSLGHEPPRR